MRTATVCRPNGTLGLFKESLMEIVRRTHKPRLIVRSVGLDATDDFAAVQKPVGMSK